MRAAFVVLAVAAASAPGLNFTGPAELVEKGRVSTASSEVRIAFSPDGARMLWGATSRPGGPGGWDIWESRKTGAAWGEPTPVSFDSPQNDFDPFVAPDGGVYFFSNRPDGMGGDDLYYAPYDAATGKYGKEYDLGDGVNTAGDEWAPAVSADGKTLLFASDGHKGKGMHDLFMAHVVADMWADPQPVAEVNGPVDDFDATYLHDGRSIVFARRGKDEDAASLYVALWKDGKYAAPQKLGPAVNAAEAWNIGPAIAQKEPGVLYFSSSRPAGAGRMDIYKIKYSLPR